jgi:fused signal recognition particle receptor
MQIGHLYIDPQQALEVLGAVGGIGLTSIFGFLLVRRARATRRRQIEGLENDSPVKESPRRRLRAEDLEPDEAEQPEGEVPEAPAAGVPDRTASQAHAGPVPEAASRPAPAEPSQTAGGPVPATARGGAPEGARGDGSTASPGARVLEFPVVPAPTAKPAAKRDLRIVEPPAEPPAPPPQPAEVPPGKAEKAKKANAWAPGLARTRSGWVSRLGQLFAGKREIDPGLLDEIEKVLLTADIGVRTSDKLLEEMRGSLSRRELGDSDAAWTFLQRRSLALLSSSAPPVAWSSAKPFVLLVIGVNGSGKTTTIGKLAARLIGEGKKVLMGAGDTFRAAAAEQLEIWGKRVGAPVVRGKEGADPSSVLFDAIKRASAEGYDVVIGDTAGRLHTKTDLMEELQKVRRVIGKAAPGAPHETWLVIDSTSGQNAIAQAQIFTQAMAVSGIVLTKLDGTAKGGVILGIADQLQIPVRFIGIGERVEDLREFDADDFVEALFDRDSDEAAARANGSN